MAGYKSIKDQIVIVLQGVSSLNAVYGKDAKELDNYPAACVSAKQNVNAYESMGSGGSNENTYQHYIRIYFPIDEKDDADYEDVLESVADDVIAALAHNVTLNGSCDYSIPLSGVWRFGEKEEAVRIFEIVEQSTLHVIR